ncbi:G-protein coupled receptor 87 [Latimeria chalumnae]|uniref:G-protein coupled receptor 87 n=1 Tax=Latimeria chalumnae TaxID=7897 RepID=UPI00313B1C38
MPGDQQILENIPNDSNNQPPIAKWQKLHTPPEQEGRNSEESRFDQILQELTTYINVNMALWKAVYIVFMYDHNKTSTNSPNTNAQEPMTRNNKTLKILIPVLYMILFIGSILLNSMATWIFLCIKKKTSFIFYLKNLVIADLLMTLTFPFKIINDSGLAPWNFNAVLCRYTYVVFYASMYVSIILLGLISLNRYFKVVKSFEHSRLCKLTFTKCITVSVWFGMFSLSLPNIILTDRKPTMENIHECSKLKGAFGLKWHAVVSFTCICIFVVILIILIVCYLLILKYIHKSNEQFMTSSKQHGKNHSIYSIIIVFFVCFVPYHLCRIFFTLNQLDKSFNGTSKTVLCFVKETTLFLSAFNVCLDPIIYFFTCKSFMKMLFERFNIKANAVANKHETKRFRKLKEITFDNKEISYPDLSPETQMRWKALNALKKELIEMEIPAFLQYPAKLKVQCQDKEYIFGDIIDAERVTGASGQVQQASRHVGQDLSFALTQGNNFHFLQDESKFFKQQRNLQDQ